MDIKIPFLGDGIDSASVLSVAVKVGDSVKIDDTILELETDKAVAPVPATASGKVTAIHVKVGDKVSAGTLAVSVDGNGAAPSEVSPSPSAAKVASPPPMSVSAAPVAAVSPVILNPNATHYTPLSDPPGGPLASVALRQIAGQLGIDLNRVPGSGKNGRIEFGDVKNYILSLQHAVFNLGAGQASSAPALAAPVKPVIKLPDFSKWGAITKKPVSSLRQKIASKMADSWVTIPHVTQFDEADIDDLMALRKKYNPKYEKKKAKLTVTVFAIKAAVHALKQFPQFNASYDEANGELILKNYYHIGIAVDTESGLIVPVIRDADKKSCLDLCLELNEIAAKARDRKLSVDELQGSTFTISNLGGLGVQQFTPIVNAPDVAILGLSKGTVRAVHNGKTFVPKLIMPVSLSYDHRVIDGADGARFMRELVSQLERFDEALLK